MVKCTACGADVPSEAPFCNNCGQPRPPQPTVQQPPTPAVQREPVFTPEPIPQQATVPPPPAMVQPAAVPPPVAMPQYTAPTAPTPQTATKDLRIWIVGIVVAAVLFGLWFQNRPQTSHTNSDKATAPPVTNVPSSQVSSPSPPVRPTIDLFVANPPYDRDGKWYTHLQWKSSDATRLVLNIGTERLDLDPGVGSRDIELTADHTVLNLTAYNGGETVVKETTVDRTQEAGAPPPTDQNTASDTAPTIDRFEAGERVDTSIGSAIRCYFVAHNAKLALLDSAGVILVDDLKSPDYIDVFITRRTVLTLKAEGKTATITKELTVAPDPKLDTELGNQETGTSLHDEDYILAVAAGLRNFSTLDPDSKSDPLSGYLSDLLQNAHQKQLGEYRNAIFARHGYIFKNKEWQDIFAQKAWYHPDAASVEAVDSRFSALERRNVTWFLSKEKTAPK